MFQILYIIKGIGFYVTLIRKILDPFWMVFQFYDKNKKEKEKVFKNLLVNYI